MRQFFTAIHRMGGAPTLHVFYHIVTDEPAPHIHALYPVRPVQQFRADLDWLLRHFIPVTLDELALPNRGNRPGFHLSFDDGLRQCYDTIMPVLLEKGIPATFFVNPAFVDNRALMYRYTASLIAQKRPDMQQELLRIPYEEKEQLEAIAAENGVDIAAFLHHYQPYMTLEQIKTLAGYGFTIGAHSMNHPMYAHISSAAQVAQTIESLDWVRTHIGVKAPPFAFPFTDFGVKQDFFNEIPEKTLSFGSAGLKLTRQKNHFQRLALEKTTRPAAYTIPVAYAAYMAKWLLGRHITEV